MDQLIDKLEDVLQTKVSDDTTRGLRIAKVFRNKEGHTVLPTHARDHSKYRDIERAVSSLYQQAFDPKLNIRISFRQNEQSAWHVT
jgi:hypothetical protein